MTPPVHPLAELIPTMGAEEYRDLVADIRKNGQREAITLYEDKILDGRHRWRACEELGLEPVTRLFNGDDPASYVLSLNVQRRNLTASQRAAVAVKFLPELEKEARKRQAHGQTAPGRSAQRSGSVEPEPNRSDHRAREDAGALVGVSGASVDRARRIKQRAPERFEEVKAGTTTVRTVDNELRAARQADAPHPVLPRETLNERQLQIADAAKRRMEKAVGMAAGINSGFPHLRPDRALSVATEEEIDGWLSVFADAARAIRQLTKQVEAMR